MKPYRFSKDIALKCLGSVVLLWALGFTVWRGFQFPMKWARAHWLVGYDFGFIKRALVGAVFRDLISPNVNSPQAEQRIDILTTATLILFLATLFGMTLRMLRRASFSAPTMSAAAVFFTSPFIVMSGHLNGYFDNILVLLTIGALLFIHFGRMLPSAILLSAGILVHETILIVGIPSALFTALLHLFHREKTKSPPRPTTARILLRLWPFLLPIATFFFLWIFQNYYLDQRILRGQLHEYFMKFDCLDRPHADAVSGAYTMTFLQYLKLQIPLAFKYFAHKIYFGQMLPTILLLLVAIEQAMAVRFSAQWSLVALLVNLCPFAMFLIATDAARLWTYPMITAMFTLWTVYDFPPAVPETESAPLMQRNLFFELMCMAAVVSNATIHVPLMCGRRDLYNCEERIFFYLPVLVVLGYLVARSEGRERNAPKTPS